MQTAVRDLGQHYPVEISAPQHKCTALKCTNRSMQFGTQLYIVLSRPARQTEIITLNSVYEKINTVVIINNH